LCSINDGKDWHHAMHPISDHYGTTGHQLLLPPNIDHAEHCLAWGHTLCCFTINSHSQMSGCWWELWWWWLQQQFQLEFWYIFYQLRLKRPQSFRPDHSSLYILPLKTG
jgi:hypothetical protein